MRNLTVDELQAVDYEEITVDATAGGKPLTSTKLNPAGAQPRRAVLITVEGADIRYRIDGVAAPTSTVGHKAVADSSFELHGNQNLRAFRAIRITTDATIRLTYYT